MPDQTPDFLYHYTDAAGLLGILRDKCVWATDVRYLNDSMELGLGLEIVGEVVKEVSDSWKHFSPQVSHSLIQHYSSVLEQFRHGVSERMRAFAASFSVESDLLSQWRAYGANGAGYALGFSYASLASLDRPPFGYSRRPRDDSDHNCSLQLVRCEYNHQRQLEKLTRAVSTVIESHEFGARLIAAKHGDVLIDRLIEEAPQADSLQSEFLGRTTATLATLKHSAFAEEQEWRIVLLPYDLRDTGTPTSVKGLRFRPRGGTIVPYLTVRLADLTGPKLGIERIVVGPRANTAEQRIALASVQELIDVNELDAEVVASAVPYRPL